MVAIPLMRNGRLQCTRPSRNPAHSEHVVVVLDYTGPRLLHPDAAQCNSPHLTSDVCGALHHRPSVNGGAISSLVSRQQGELSTLCHKRVEATHRTFSRHRGVKVPETLYRPLSAGNARQAGRTVRQDAWGLAQTCPVDGF